MAFFGTQQAMSTQTPYRPLATQRRLLSNTVLLTAGQAIVQLLNFGLVVALARVYGQELLGIYSFSMSVGALLCILVSLGTHGLLLQRITHEPERTASYTSALFGFQLSVAIAIVLATHLVARWMSPGETYIWVLTSIVAFHVLTRVNSLFVLGFTARQEAGEATTIPLARLAIALVLAGAAIAAGASAPVALAAMPIAALLVLVASVVRAVRRFGALPVRFNRAEIVSYLKDGMPFFYVVALSALYTRLGVILLTAMKGEAATGSFAAGERLIVPVVTVFSMLAMALQPVLTQLWSADRGRFAELTQRVARLTFLISLPAITLLALFSGDIVHILYAGRIGDAAEVLTVIAWVLLARGYGQLLTTAATAADRQQILVRGRVIGIALLIIASVALIPAQGALGLAIATLAGESAFAASTYALLRRDGVPLAVPAGILRVILACLVAAGCIWLARDLALPWRVLGAACVMSAALWLFGAVRTHDLAYLRAVVGAREKRGEAQPDA